MREREREKIDEARLRSGQGAVLLHICVSKCTHALLGYNLNGLDGLTS